MEQFKKELNDLQTDNIKILQHLSRLIMTETGGGAPAAKKIDNYLCDLENFCIRSRVLLEKYRPTTAASVSNEVNEQICNICGELEVTREGWLHIRLNTLLPNCKYRISNYIGDTISRLILNYDGELPYFEKAFMAIVEYCNYENHNALDNDNKGWKMIPNAIKGSVIEDDSQFVLSIGLFTKISENAYCDIYIMPPEDGSIFMEMLYSRW